MESVLLRLPIRKTQCCVDGGGSWVDLMDLQGNLSESSHGSWRRATRVFLGYTYHFRSFSSRLRHISAAARAFATSASGLVMEWSMMRDGLPPVCVTFWHSLAALHLSSAFRVAHRAPRASRSRSVRRPAKPHGRPYNAPSAGGEESILCTVPVLSACVGRGQRSRL
jgi:hypothetical protein